MSTLKTTFIQHPSAEEPSIELSADGTIVLPLSGIGDLADVDEGSGAADGDVLTYDASGNLWIPQGIVPIAGIGSNVATAVKTDTFTTSSTDLVDVTGLSVTITPSTATSRILLIATVMISVNVTGGTVRGTAAVSRGGTTLAEFVTGNSMGDNKEESNGGAIVILDSPATGDPVTYVVRARQVNGGSAVINASRSAPTGEYASSLTAIEVAP